MKNLLLILVALMVAFNAEAQDDPKRMLRNAKRALNSYYLDQLGNVGKLTEAKDLIDQVVVSSEYSNSSEAWYERGRIYAEIAMSDLTLSQFNPSHKSANPNASLIAQQAFEKAYDLAEKGFQKKDALKGMSENVQALSNYGYIVYQDGDQKEAFKAFESVLYAHNLLAENKERVPFSNDEELDNQIYIVAVTALGAGETVKAEKYLNQLLDRKADKPEIYNALYQLMVEKGDDENASKYLQTGRKKYPDDITLLFSEINDALRKGKLDELVGRLKEAIEKEPENVSLYTTLGNVYDNLFQNTEDKVTKEQYFEEAKKYYGQALELKPGYFDALYSMGALYYNKAAEKTQILLTLADDYTAAGLKKYQEMQKEINAVFELALPYFLEADKINNQDKNTMIALKEIYARLNQLDKSNEYKEKLEALENN
jgi:hypothetical protein